MDEGLNFSETELKRIEKEYQNVLNEQENGNLIKKIQQKDSVAEVQLINKYKLFIKKFARIYAKNGLEEEDLIQEGNTGLILAGRRFDLNQNYTLS